MIQYNFANVTDRAKSLIMLLEGFIPRVKDVGDGVPTVGYGYPG